MQSVDLDQGTHYRNYAQVKGLQKYQNGKTEKKARIRSFLPSDAPLTSAQEHNLTLLLLFQ